MGLLAILGGAWLSGGWLARRAGLPPTVEARLVAALAASAALTPLLAALAAWSLPGAQAALAVLVGALLLAPRPGAAGTGPAPPPVSEPWSPFERVCAAAVGLSLAATLLSALAPATAWDAAVAHLALPADYARLGRMVPNPGNVYSGYPHFAHTLFALAHYPGLEKSTTLFAWSLGALACLAAGVLGARVAGRRVGWIAAAILATAPVFVDQGGAVGVDLVFAAYTAAALCALFAWRDTRHAPWLWMAALIAGASCGIRHTGLLAALFLALAVPFAARDRRARHAAVFGAAAFAAAAPWLLRAWWVTGNPVFPFLAEWFPSPAFPHIGITALGAHETVARGGGIGIAGLLRFPWDIVMRPAQFDGWSKSPGVLVLALGLPGLVVGGPRARALGIFSVAGIAAFYAFQRFARYLLPFFLPMMVVAAVAAERIRPLRWPVRALLAATFAHGLLLHAAAIHFKVPVTLGMQSRDEYLTQRIERYPAFQWANRHLNDGGVLLTVDQRSYYLDPPAFQNHWAMNALAEMPPEAQRAWLAARGIRHLMIPMGLLAESHALAPFRGVVDAWRRDTAHFERLETIHVPRRDGGTERVEFYRFRESPDVSSARPEAD